MNFSEATEFLLELPDLERSSQGKSARTMSLEAMHALLHRLGNPELGRRTAHVTGSKGKGSTSAFLSAMLATKGPTSLYSSPHLHSFRERICLDLDAVSESEFAQGVEAILGAVTEEHKGALGPISTFGAMTALFFQLSMTHHVRWQTIEVGMGGLYDATNVFPNKELVVITPVSLEHTKILGNSTLEIAENKAGIIRPGSIVVLAPQKDSAVNELIRRLCMEQGAGFIDVSTQYKINNSSLSAQGQQFELESRAGQRQFNIKMLGHHQLENATTAIASIDALSEDYEQISTEEMQIALENLFLPGRIELVHNAPNVVIDGAHNGESVSALIAALHRHYPSKQTVFVLGANSDKNIDDIIENLSLDCRAIIATQSKSLKAMDPDLISQSAKRHNIDCCIVNSSNRAIEKAIEISGKDGLVCATGSLYLVAEIREYFMGTNPNWTLRASKMSTEKAI